MSPADDIPAGPDGDDILAAEYVLGVLDRVERQAATDRISTEPTFAAVVEAWEGRLAPLGDGYLPIDVPPAVKAAIDRRLFAGPAQGAAAGRAHAGLLSSLRFWRRLAGAAMAALVLAITIPLVRTPVVPPVHPMMASLDADGSPVHFLAMVDPATGEVSLSHVAGERGTGRDFELWLIRNGDPPVSMGTIPAGATVHMAMAPELYSDMSAGVTLAVSDEPAGGSPTGQPTGAIIAAGELRGV